MQAANETNAQSDRMPNVTNDESWLYIAGMISQFEKRAEGTFPFSRFCDISTAAKSEDDDIHTLFESGSMHEFNLSCECCEGLFVPLMGKESRELYGKYTIQWDEVGTIEEKVKSVRVVCPHCDHEHFDTRKTRFAMYKQCDYVQMRKEAAPHNFTCRFNAWTVWFVKWETLLREYLEASRLSLMGDKSKLIDFYIKRMSQTWRNQSVTKSEIKPTADYSLELVETSMGDLWVAPEWEQETARYMAAGRSA